MIYIYPYKLASESARKLRDGLSSFLGYRVKLVKPDGKFNPRRTDKVINWGNSKMPNWYFDERDRNDYTAIEAASNKLISFQLFKLYNINTPEWTEDINEAKQWFNKPKTKVLCRKVLNGHSGTGIHIASNPDELVGAPLYVKYKPKREEYRVHVAFGKVIDTQLKKRRAGYRERKDVDYLVRNWYTGWVYCREEVQPNEQRDTLAIKAVNALGLDFGAVDIIYNELEDKYYVLEVNTAPGLDGTTVDKYVEVFAK